MEDLMQQGKRDLACNEYTKAVNSFQSVCESLSKEHGDSAVHLAEPYFYYGCALLEVSRMESDVLGNALEGVPEGDETSDNNIVEEDDHPLTEEEREKLSDEVIDAMCDKEEKQDDQPATDVASDQKDDVNQEGNTECSAEPMSEKQSDAPNEESIDNKEVDGDEVKDGEPDEDEGDNDEEENEEDGEEDESEEDVSNLQLAWEVLELAKKYYTELGDSKENKLKVSDCHFKLGEIGLEKEDYEQAVADFSECLQIRKIHLSDDDRSLAEVHFQLGVAHGANNAYTQAISEFELCRQVLERRLQSLESRKGEESSEQDGKITPEVEQIKGLIPEINQRISEANEDRFDFDQIKKTVREGFATVSNVFSGVSANDSADDISHLVRKKRKADEAAPAEINGTTNGHSGVNGNSDTTANGDNAAGNTDAEDNQIPVSKKVKVADETESDTKTTEVVDMPVTEVV